MVVMKHVQRVYVNPGEMLRKGWCLFTLNVVLTEMSKQMQKPLSFLLGLCTWNISPAQGFPHKGLSYSVPSSDDSFGEPNSKS